MRRLLRNLSQQTYRRWQVLPIANAKLAGQLVVSRELLNDRIRVVDIEDEADLSTGLEVARRCASGDFIGVVDALDMLAPHALAEMAEYLLWHSECDVVYCDEDCISPFGRRHSLRLKPNWSPEMLLGFNYIGRLCLIRSDLLQQAGGFDARFAEAQEYEALLRIGEKTTRIQRLPQCLYHRRAGAESRYCDPRLISSEEFALREHLQRLGTASNNQNA